MQMRWNILQPDPGLVQQLQRRFDCHPVTAVVLANRLSSAADADHFLKPTLDALPPPSLLPGIEAGVDRICRAVQQQEQILVFGDYDADGITAASVMTAFLNTAGARAVCHLPERSAEGYGLQPMHVMQLAVPRKAGLIITVDCGSSSCEAVAAARRFGIDTVITDHHNIGAPYPEAAAIINPKVPGTSDELSMLAGVGVAFYLVIALRARLRELGWWRGRPEPNLKACCDLVALGTVADMVPLTGANRILTRAGLEQINCGARPGIQALLGAGGIHNRPVGADDIAYRLAPRINAAGRIAHPAIAYDLLNTADPHRAAELAESLNALNSRRQGIENQMLEQIVGQLESRPDMLSRPALLLAGEGWHEGVLGIVAAKLAARYHRPTVLIATRDGMGKGSGRSVPELDLHTAVGRCAHLLVRFGGHRQAAGLSVRTENIADLRAAFEMAVAEMLPGGSAGPRMTIDCEVRLDQIDGRLMSELQDMEPFGAENPAPVFMARDLCVINATLLGQRHRLMTVCHPVRQDQPLSAIHFNLPQESQRIDHFGRVAFRLQWNRFRGCREIQLVVEAHD